MARLSFYRVDADYCDFLRTTDPNIPYTRDSKKNRPFVGIVLEVQNFKYFAPLSSPKPKHRQMKNNVDFIKIQDGAYGVINLNNMIPIHQNSLTKVDVAITQTDTDAQKAYKRMLANQLTWCNANRDFIIKKAERLYKTIISGTAHLSLSQRCCNFRLDEQNLQNYIIQNNWQ